MKARECIVELAKELAAQSRNRVHTHESELHAAEQHVAELIAKLSASKLEHSRSAQFEPERGGKLQCPRCWILNATHSDLSAAVETGAVDLLECPKCGIELGVPFNH
jgi:hypothetical protein